MQIIKIVTIISCLYIAPINCANSKRIRTDVPDITTTAPAHKVTTSSFTPIAQLIARPSAKLSDSGNIIATALYEDHYNVYILAPDGRFEANSYNYNYGQPDADTPYSIKNHELIMLTTLTASFITKLKLGKRQVTV